MSGWQSDGSYGLTRTKAAHWHEGQIAPTRNAEGRLEICPCGNLEEIVAAHLLPAGFAVTIGSGGNWVSVRGPGLDRGDTGPMYVAISGRKGARGAQWEREAWARKFVKRAG